MKSKEWFADWFDTSYYHILYKNRNDQEAERFISKLVNNLHLPPMSTVLDLACGKGRHSVTLNKLGYDVLGVDLSPQSIAHASKMASQHLQFAVQDMREPIPGKSFDAVFNLFTSFGYFDAIDDNQRVIKSVKRMLKPQGLLIIDFMNARQVIDALVEDEQKTIEGITFNIQREYNGTHIIKHIRFEDNSREFSYTERVQALQLADFRSLLEDENFQILRTFGDFDLQPYQEESSERLIIIARNS